MNKRTILGKEFHFGIGFLNKLIDGTGKDFNTLIAEIESSPISTIPKMVYFSLAYSYDRASKEYDFTINDIYDLIDDNETFSVDFLNAFMESVYKDVPVDNSKKKVTKTVK